MWTVLDCCNLAGDNLVTRGIVSQKYQNMKQREHKLINSKLGNEGKKHSVVSISSSSAKIR